MHSDVTNELYVLFLKPVLSSVQHVNKAFQANEADPSKFLQDLTLVIKSLAKMVRGRDKEQNKLRFDGLVLMA